MTLVTYKLLPSHFFPDFFDKTTQLMAVAKNDLPDSTTVRVKKKAGDRVRTGDNQLGKLVLYQLSYTRKDYTL